MSVVSIHRRKEPKGAAPGTRGVLDKLIEALADAAATEEHERLMPVRKEPDQKRQQGPRP